MLDKLYLDQNIRSRMMAIRNKQDKNKLLIHEIYASVQGESTYMGLPCVFVRTTGCHLRCNYCDTAHAFSAGQELDIEKIITQVANYKINLVELTGGEPLLQNASFLLLEKLVALNLTVLLETSGALSIKKVPQKVKVILDIKTPSSLENSKNNWQNLEILWPGCEVKFVLSNFDDYEFAKKIISDFSLITRVPVLFSPVVEKFSPQELAQRIVKDKIPVRFQYQLHRVLFGEQRGK